MVASLGITIRRAIAPGDRRQTVGYWVSRDFLTISERSQSLQNSLQDLVQKAATPPAAQELSRGAPFRLVNTVDLGLYRQAIDPRGGACLATLSQQSSDLQSKRAQPLDHPKT
ncbi:MAG: hypothetical protein EA001_07840 [Oscillatoriales cyanobacterium]|nr:MAG: hypothetical protein EA001_07840 [Oscillatoriales cyanobacterium]